MEGFQEFDIVAPQPPPIETVIMMSALHNLAHNAREEQDPDTVPETVSVPFNREQHVLLTLGFLFVGTCYPCLKDACADAIAAAGIAVRDQRPGEEGWDDPDLPAPWEL